MKKNYFLIMIVLGFCSRQKELSKEGSNTNISSQVDVYVAGADSVFEWADLFNSTPFILSKNAEP